MSLLNQVLTEMDQRNPLAVHHNDLAKLGVRPVAALAPPSPAHPRWWLAGGVVVAVLGGGGWWFWSAPQPAEPSVVVAAVAAPVKPAPVEVVAAPVERVVEPAKPAPVEVVEPAKAASVEVVEPAKAAPVEVVAAPVEKVVEPAKAAPVEVVAAPVERVVEPAKPAPVEVVEPAKAAPVAVAAAPVVPEVPPQVKLPEVPPLARKKEPSAAAVAAVEPAPRPMARGGAAGGSSGSEMTMAAWRPSGAEQARVLMEQARASADAHQAKRWLQQAVELDPELLEAQVLLGERLLELGALQEARGVARRLRERYPGAVDGLYLGARVAVGAGDLYEAIPLLKQAISQGEERLEIPGLLAYIYQKQQRYEEAEPIYRILVEHEPRNGSWWLGLAVSLDNLGRSREAVEIYRRVVSGGGLEGGVAEFARERLAALTQSGE